MKTRSSQPRSVTFLYGGIAGVLLMVIATVALIVAPPSPPSLAEYAPGAMDTIEEAPESQLSRFGVGDGGCPPGLVCDPVTGEVISAPPGGTGPRTIDKSRVRRCVGDPPRQTEDPQSPPCVNFWEGDNGGATYKGVTRDEIRVVIDTGGALREPSELLVEFFNRRFEFYGRRLRAYYWTRESSCTPEIGRAMAAEIEEIQAFAVSGPPSCQSFEAEIARRGLIAVADRDRGSTSNSDHYRRLRPYLWSYYMLGDERLSNLGEMACSSLVGRPASHGDPAQAHRYRSFGVLINTFRVFNSDEGFTRSNADPLIRALARCGAAPVAISEVDRDDPVDYQVAVADLKAAGATTIVCLCQIRFFDNQAAASKLPYFPEWLLIGLREVERQLSLPQADKAQAARTFGVSGGNKRKPLDQEPSTWAINEIDPSYRGGGGPYQALLLLASGIQMAGPNLTPQTFERGLQGALFPNPGAGSPPFWQARVGFGPGDHSMIDDLALTWFEPSLRPSEESPGSVGGFCYIDQGARWSLGSWPDQEHAFFDRSQPCR